MKSDEASDESINGVYVSATAFMVLCLFNAGVEAVPGQVGWLCKWKFQSLQLEVFKFAIGTDRKIVFKDKIVKV